LSASELAAGTVLVDRYRLVRVLGRGAMGNVYEGQHVRTSRRVAIKVLHPELAKLDTVRARFSREAQAATAAGHPNIVEVLDLDVMPDGLPFLVLEYLEGRDLAVDLAREGPQRVDKTAHIVAQTCRALAAAHAKGVVHRDLKPANLFIAPREGDPWFVKVVDFGISKIELHGIERLTKTGTAIGTPFNMSPEQCRESKNIDHRSDIFSLGIVLYHAFTGHRPFEAKPYARLVQQIMTAMPPPISHSRPDVPPDVVELVQRMLAKDPAHRPQSCAEIAEILRPHTRR
jgi:serine/threonine protein kinase